jgi:hypothetical protein
LLTIAVNIQGELARATSYLSIRRRFLEIRIDPGTLNVPDKT